MHGYDIVIIVPIRIDVFSIIICRIRDCLTFLEQAIDVGKKIMKTTNEGTQLHFYIFVSHSYIIHKKDVLC